MHFFAFRSLTKNAKIFAFFAKFRLNLLHEKSIILAKKRNEKFREQNNAKISLRFRIFTSLISGKNAKFREKDCEIQTKMFAFFRETLAGNSGL